MPHFFIVVLVEKDTSNILEKVTELLLPFNDNIEVEPYKDICYCIGTVAYEYGANLANSKIESIDELRKEYYEKMDSFENETPQAWDVFIKTWSDFQKENEEKHELYHKPDPACKECKGTGFVISTKNPVGKYDFWTIGGRYDGEVIENSILTPKAQAFKKLSMLLNQNNISKNMNIVENLSPKFKCFAIVTPTGYWWEKEEPGWAGIVTSRDKSWLKTMKSVLAQHKDCLAVGCDLHF